MKSYSTFAIMKQLSVQELIAANRALWNQRTDAHMASQFYANQDFINGKSSLNTIELSLLGEINNKSLLHLQCHFGQDTLSLQRLGAQCTGVDFSNTAIAAAQTLNAQLGLNARFVCSNVYETRENVSDSFDIVFTSYGTIGWLPELESWAKVIAESLKPGGIFVICDFHPYVWMMDEDYKNIKYSYFNTEIIETDTTGSYAAGNNLHAPMKEYGWNHPLADLLGSLLRAGLQLEVFNEYDGSPYNCFPDMEQHADGMYRFKHWGKNIPLVYGIRFRKVK